MNKENEIQIIISKYKEKYDMELTHEQALKIYEFNSIRKSDE